MKVSPNMVPKLLLRLDKLERGDVLLTLGSGKMSKAIALFSGGEFSHSALCTSPYMIFESDGETEIGHKVLKTVGYLHGRSKLEQYGKIPGDPVRGAVYRHPEMVSISPQQFEEALKKAKDQPTEKPMRDFDLE